MPRLSVQKSILAVALVAPLFGAGLIQPDSTVTVHEWGTFTSVAGEHGESVVWAPLTATSDLPCFVHTLGNGLGKYMPGLVRMETPVDYFYTQTPTKISVHVGFPSGTITEWYPKASSPDTYGAIDWADLNILPGASLKLPSSKGESRYYAARATDSAMVQSGGENEKLLFYRGMANFKVPVEPAYTADGLRIRNTGTEPISLAILFENQNGRVGYRITRDFKGEVLVKSPELNGTVEVLRRDLIAELEHAGMYPKEAVAMLETWKDSWFEEGMRVIYLTPRATVDNILPLKIAPAPRDVQRAFVGRVEILSPATEQKIRTAMGASDTAGLQKMGRFLQPFVTEMKDRHVLTDSRLEADYVQQIAGRIGSGPAQCVQ